MEAEKAVPWQSAESRKDYGIQDVVLQHTGNFGEAHFCDLFTKDTTKDLGNLQESLIPTQYLLDLSLIHILKVENGKLKIAVGQTVCKMQIIVARLFLYI